MGIVNGSSSQQNRSIKRFLIFACYKGFNSSRVPNATFPWYQRSHSKQRINISYPERNNSPSVCSNQFPNDVEAYKSRRIEKIDTHVPDLPSNPSGDAIANECPKEILTENNVGADSSKRYNTADLVAKFESLNSQYRETDATKFKNYKCSQYNNQIDVQPSDNKSNKTNNDSMDDENKNKVLNESLDAEYNDTNDPEEANSRLKDCFKTYEERQKYKSIIQDAPLYQIYTEKVARNESKRDARRLLAIVQPGSVQNPSNNLKFNDDLFAAIDGDDSEVNNQYSPTLLNNGRNSPRSSYHTKNSGRTDAIIHSLNGDSSQVKPSNTDTSRPPSYKRSHSNSTISEKSGNRKTLPKPRRQTHEVQNFVNEVAGTGPNRVQWAAMPQVVNAELAKDMPEYQRKLQEALFEVITSEASYYRTLHILMEKFYKAPCMQPESKSSVISATEKRHLFSNISEIFFTSETFLRDMELYFLQNPLIPQLCEIIYEHAEFHFENYVKYVQNQMYQLRTLSKLQSSPAFVEAVRSVQQQPSCGFLDLNSFLLLPMQRVTRLRLLLIAILHYAPKNSVTYQGGLVALASLERLIGKCDSEKAHMEQKERLVDLCRRLEYKYDAKSLATESRTLVKEGDLRILTMTNAHSSGFHRRFSSIRKPKPAVATLFLFSDYLLITKKRSNQHLLVEDSCSLDYIHVEAKNTPPNSFVHHFCRPGNPELNSQLGHATFVRTLSLSKPTTNEIVNFNNQRTRKFSTDMSNGPDVALNAFSFLLIIEGPDHPRVQYEFQTETLSKRERWLDGLSAGRHGVPEKLGSEICECPQVLITKPYSALECDELELKEGDQVNVLISLSDGWLKGALPDGRRGWFPSHICVEVKDSSMKRENMKNFMLMEEAKAAYWVRKNRETFDGFPRVKDVRRSQREMKTNKQG
uniref:DH domain-containing protein n=1 Tax=Trichobilharzia regenti TaxID=157069 RepID=A0AA85JTW4_TRIRE|nr:unnamed protein product [Trichobilharzia regenti]